MTRLAAEQDSASMSEENEGVRHIRSLRKMLYFQKDEASAQIKQAVADLEQKLLEQLDTAFWRKLVEVKNLEDKARSCSFPLAPLHFFRSTEVRSLLSLECLKVSDFECSSFAYINACEAKPDQLHFVDDYGARVSKTGDTVRVYYMCSLDYDPVLFKYLSVLVKDTVNKTVSCDNRDLRNGCYMLEFKACEEGSYLVFVKVYGQNISGSPVSISVRDDDSLPLPELPRSRVEVTFPELSQSCGEVALSEVSQSRMEVTLPELPRSCVKESLTWERKPVQEQEEILVQPQHFYDIGLQQLEAEEEADTHSQQTQMVAVKQLTSPETREVFNPEVSVAGLSVGSANSLLTSTPVPHCNTNHSGECAPTSRETVRSVLDGAAQEEERVRSPVIKRPGAKSFTKFSGTVNADLVLEFKAYSRNDYFSFPIGISATAEGSIIVGDTGHDRVIVFDAEARPLCKATLPGSVHFRRPSAVVALDDGSFAVKDDRCIYLFSKAGEYIRTLGKDSLVRPFGLATHKGNSLVTLSLDSPAKLWHFSAAGDFEASAVYSPLQPLAPAGSKCRFLDVHEDSVFVADLGLSHIYKTSVMGEGTSIFGKKGKEPGDFCEPSGVSAADKCLFIGDSKNNRIQVFDFDGNFMNVVNLSSRIIRPSGIHVSADKLYVLNYLRGIVGVYNLSLEGTGM